MSGEQKTEDRIYIPRSERTSRIHKAVLKENAALKESLAELIEIADYYHDREVTYTDMPYKNWTAAIYRAKKLIAENRESILPPRRQEQES